MPALLLGALLAAGPAPAADVEAGKRQAQVCSACHGANGISQMKEVPSLAGQTDGFIQWQLVFFRSETRKNALMTPLAAALGDEDIKNFGAYFASLPPAKASAEGPGASDLKQHGALLARQNRCASCHGVDFAGVAAAPRIAGQREDYLLKALRDFKSGARTGGGGAAMPEAVYPLSDDDLKALAHFFAGFS